MEHALNELQIVILDNPSVCWESQLVRSYFNEVINLKLKGYRSRYQKNLMPLNSDDFFAKHILICLKEKVMLAYKSVPMARYQMYQKSFALTDFLKQVGTIGQQKQLDVFLSKHKSKNLVYNSSLTIDPQLDQYLELKWQILDIFNMLALASFRSDHVEYGLTVANLDFNTQKTFKRLGLVSFFNEFDGEKDFAMPEFDNLRGTVMLYDLLNYQCAFAEAKVKEYSLLWNQRIELSEETIGKSQSVSPDRYLQVI